MSAESPSPPAQRASDADRDRVIELLRAAVTDGRLDPTEFDERLDKALAARTFDALAPLTADLIATPGSVGALTLPHRLVLRTAWCDVRLDLTKAVRSGPEFAISSDDGDSTPESLQVHLVGRMKHGRIGTRWESGH